MSASDESASLDAKQRNQYRIESLAKGLQVLRLFDETVTSLRLREVVERTGLPMPTAFRIVSTLEEEGFLDRTDDGVLHPGVAVLTLGSAALRGSSLVSASERPLRSLAQATGETVNLGVLQGDQVLYLVRLRNADLVTANIQVGSTLPAAFTSMGKVLLAYLTPEELAERVADATFGTGQGPNAVGSRAALTEQLEQIRERGYAVQDQELALGLRSVAVPVFAGGSAPVAAINVAVSAARHDVDALRGPILERVLAAAHEIGLRLAAA
ncbi:IclR family transcriptional regulator [uncultured Amnibacterium sp.]|uniref:IclR family transcriptional regulator n=1 Tax=uncultured Amnibacterium sp. TaxID=1631851 RepID=UPI0035C96B8C